MKNANCRLRGYLASQSIALLCAFILGPVGLAHSFGRVAVDTSDRRTNQARPNAQLALSAEEIRGAEQRLSDLGYWTGPVDGVLDVGSRHALIAFQKVENRQRTGELTQDELQGLRTANRRPSREIGYAHLEIDLSRQVLFAIDSSGLVSKILPVSTGTGKLFTSEGRTRRAVTPCGRFTITHKIAGWRKSPLGLLYYPN